MPSTWTYDPTDQTSAISALRLQLADTDFSNVGETVPRGQQTALFSDQEYQSFLAMANGDTTVALIRALRTIAYNRTIMAVAVNLGGGGNVDFTRMGDMLLKQADALWAWYCEIPAEAWAEIDTSPFAAQRIAWADLLRSTS